MVTALSPITFLATITLGPALFGLAIFLLHLAGRATWRLTLGLAIVAALVPVVGLPFLGQYVAGGDPIALLPFGRGVGFSAWVLPSYRMDAFALYAAVGIAYLIVPVLLWLAFADHPQGSPVRDELAVDSAEPVILPADTHDLPQQRLDDDTADDKSMPTPESAEGVVRVPASRDLVRSIALVLVLETTALTLAFADNIVLLGIAWIVLALLAWVLGELSSEPDTVDRIGLAAMVAGPVFWLALILLPATAAQSARFIELTGRAAISPVQCILLAIAVALAAGAYPFTAWLRRRAALATPVGLTAAVLAVLPAALYVASRTYAVAIDANNRWPLFGAAPRTAVGPPPVTAGIAFAVLGAVTVAICGLLALNRRDGRTLVALLAAAQVGWGLVGLGSGQPAAVLGVTLLLPSAMLGLGAMLAALVAGGVLTSDDEPDAFGPIPVHASPRPLALAAWSIGGLSLLGAPLLAGFAPRHLMSAGGLQTSGLLIPLNSLCWIGDALFALALLRATAPALAGAGSHSFARSEIRDLAATVLGVLALALGIAPAGMIGLFGKVAAAALVAPASVGTLVAISPAGYAVENAQWLSVIAWITVLVVGALIVALRPLAGRSRVPIYYAGSDVQSSSEQSAASDTELPTEPSQVWSDLGGAFDSPFTMPGREWLIAGIDDDDEDTHDDPDASEADAAATEGEPVAATAEEKTHGTD